MTARALLRQLRALGVDLIPLPEGKVRYLAPKGTMTTALLTVIRQHKAELRALVEDLEERAALAHYCGGLAWDEAERLAWQCVLTPHAGCAACGVHDPNGAPP